MAVETVVSIGAGLLAGSLSLLAFGGDSVIELVSSYAVTSYLRILSRGVDTSEAHTERTERIVAILLILLIPAIFSAAVVSFLLGVVAEPSPLGIAIAIGAVIIMPLLWVQKRSIGERANLLPLTMDAVESATCFLMSVALFAGLLFNYFLHIAWADYVATAIILVFVAREAREYLVEVRHDKHVRAH